MVSKLLTVAGVLATLFWLGYFIHCQNNDTSKKVNTVDSFHIISAGTFPATIHVFISTDTDMVKRYEPDMNFNAAACTVYSDSTGEISVWFPKLDSTEDSRLTLLHEMQHVTYAVLQFSGISHSGYTDEVYSYELEFLIKQIYTLTKH